MLASFPLLYQYVHENSFVASGDGTKRQKIVILLTDGKNNAQPPPLSWANSLKGSNVTIIAIGVGKDFSSGGDAKGELEQLASNKDYVLTSTSFDQLKNLIDKVVEMACEGNDIFGNIAAKKATD